MVVCDLMIQRTLANKPMQYAKVYRVLFSVLCVLVLLLNCGLGRGHVDRALVVWPCPFSCVYLGVGECV